ncbi:hypothetical protein TSAR_016552 [Trichomalopsis sarcophagae]|uniref:Uncharacterized protein n=1 Tax=Trichomalopsis sarcophagae TaxID=543379 RepID=A0A232EKK8_9HYME|nr:hypothetical protein TSAR_016552 [Trichomalopsis sarcophagae]
MNPSPADLAQSVSGQWNGLVGIVVRSVSRSFLPSWGRVRQRSLDDGWRSVARVGQRSWVSRVGHGGVLSSVGQMSLMSRVGYGGAYSWGGVAGVSQSWGSSLDDGWSRVGVSWGSVAAVGHRSRLDDVRAGVCHWGAVAGVSHGCAVAGHHWGADEPTPATLLQPSSRPPPRLWLTPATLPQPWPTLLTLHPLWPTRAMLPQPSSRPLWLTLPQPGWGRVSQRGLDDGWGSIARVGQSGCSVSRVGQGWGSVAGVSQSRGGGLDDGWSSVAGVGWGSVARVSESWGGGLHDGWCSVAGVSWGSVASVSRGGVAAVGHGGRLDDARAGVGHGCAVAGHHWGADEVSGVGGGEARGEDHELVHADFEENRVKQTISMYKFVILAACLAAANAGNLIGAPVVSSYSAPVAATGAL